MTEQGILKDPEVPTGDLSVIGWIGWTIFMICAFIFHVEWMVIVVEIVVWLLFGLSAFIFFGCIVCEDYPGVVKDIELPVRLPKWWLLISMILSTSILWFFSGGVMWLTIMWVFSRIVLSINYQFIEECHDIKYTKQVMEFGDIYRK